MPSLPVLVALSLLTATVGALGGLGGAVFLVPILVLVGVDPKLAAPLGMLSVAAGSLSAAPRQLDDGLVHHRLGVTLEIPSSLGAIVGAVIGGVIAKAVLARVLAAVALAAALAGLARKGVRNRPHATFAAEEPGEWPGTLGGAYELGGEIVPYHAERVPAGLAAMAGAGLVSGLAGVGGGFIKTPAMSEIMRLPVKVAAATTTFTVAITSATSLIVFAGQGRIDYRAGAAVVVGGLAGGRAGSVLQSRLRPEWVRWFLSVALIAVSGVILVTGR